MITKGIGGGPGMTSLQIDHFQALVFIMFHEGLCRTVDTSVSNFPVKIRTTRKECFDTDRLTEVVVKGAGVNK